MFNSKRITRKKKRESVKPCVNMHIEPPNFLVWIITDKSDISFKLFYLVKTTDAVSVSILRFLFPDPTGCKIFFQGGVFFLRHTAKRTPTREIYFSKYLYSGYQSHAPLNDFFLISKIKFWRTSFKMFPWEYWVVFISCQFHRQVRSSLDQVKSLSNYDKVICNFAEMEGYYLEKTLVCLWITWEKHF